MDRVLIARGARPERVDGGLEMGTDYRGNLAVTVKMSERLGHQMQCYRPSILGTHPTGGSCAIRTKIPKHA